MTSILWSNMVPTVEDMEAAAGADPTLFSWGEQGWEKNKNNYEFMTVEGQRLQKIICNIFQKQH